MRGNDKIMLVFTHAGKENIYLLTPAIIVTKAIPLAL